MDYDFTVSGHGWKRDVFYTQNGMYESFSMPAGALLVAEILEKSGAKLAPALVPGPQRREHLSLARAANGVFSVKEHAGISPGNTRLVPEKAALAVVWDEGFDAVRAPESGFTLWTSPRRIPLREDVAAFGGRVFLLLPADVLRAAGALISRQVSWERSATDLVWQLAHNPALSHLRGIPEMLVPFSEDGAVYIRRENGKTHAELVLLHGGFEGELREKYARDLPDAWAVTVAGTALAWKACLDDPAGTTALSPAGILRPAADLVKNGYDLELLKTASYGKWLERGRQEGAAFTFPVPDVSRGNTADPEYWCISASMGEGYLYDLARRYVLEGPPAIEGVPRFSCGALTTVDRKEVESFQNIRNLIRDYARAPASRPLCIAVFGTPGSGKSFGVTQIAKNLLPGVAKLEFNVSQMSSPTDLAAAFHAVRDAALSGVLPLVFFDEFDSDRDGRPLGWLKNFLMPMQDGTFKDESGEHPVGKCIMVFAGGTASSFDQFREPLSCDDPLRFEAFKNLKGPDFISRLRGVINVLGPNPAVEGEHNFLLRRALLLRSLLERKFKAAERIRVDESVLEAMLLIPRFTHGARSMEAVLDMSGLEGTSWDPASLPFYTQLSLHVDADAFIRLVLKDVVLNAACERIARQIHERFLAKGTVAGGGAGNEEGGPDAASYLVAWDELPEEIKNSNRAQARHIPEKLRSVGCGFDAGDTPYQTLTEFSEEETLFLAKSEHERWMANKIAHGWKYGPRRDNAGKIHPCLVAWDKLPREERQKDVDMVRAIIPLLHEAGLRVYKKV